MKTNFDLIYKNATKKGKNSETYSDDLKSENYFSSILTTSLPLKKMHNNYQSNFTPKGSLRFSPFNSENISTLERQLNITNIFSKNRLGLSDLLEGGQSLTIGFDYDILRDNDSVLFHSSLGQIFRDTTDKRLYSIIKHNAKQEVRYSG